MFYKETIDDAQKYSDKIVKTLNLQKKKYDIIKSLTIDIDKSQFVNSNNNFVLQYGTLIHGTDYNEQKLLNIKREGILSSEFAINKPEQYNETHHMADFFKVVSNKPVSIPKLLNSYNRNSVIDYLPNNKQDNYSSKIAFIVNTNNDVIKKYLEVDLFTDNNTSLWDFIDEDFFFSIAHRKVLDQYHNLIGQSSIPLGVPYSALCGIIIDFNIEHDKDKLSFIKENFGKDLFIVSTDGAVISEPNISVSKDSDGITL